MKSEQVLLTVAESKRLIAKGVRTLPKVKRALKSGIIAVAKGTTNRYVAEELLGRSLAAHPYANAISSREWENGVGVGDDIPEVILVRGVPKKISLQQAVMVMSEGDIFVKGGNALNCREGKVGVLSGCLDGGTIGRLIGSILGRRATLLIPIGLEKTIHEDIDEISRKLQDADVGLVLFSVRGEIVTEIEALRNLAGVHSCVIGAGGVQGSEGSIRLMLEGSPVALQRARTVIDLVRGEKAYSPGTSRSASAGTP